MSVHSESYLVPLQRDAARRVCREAATTIGWLTVEKDDRRLVCIEHVCPIVPLPFRVVVEVRLESVGPAVTRIELVGFNVGGGPVQERLVRIRVRRLRDQIQNTAGVCESVSSRSLVVNEWDEV